MTEIAAAHGVTPTRLAPSWLLHRGEHLLAIPGTTSSVHLKDNLAAVEMSLSVAEMAVLDAVGGAGS